MAVCDIQVLEKDFLTGGGFHLIQAVQRCVQYIVYLDLWWKGDKKFGTQYTTRGRAVIISKDDREASNISFNI